MNTPKIEIIIYGNLVSGKNSRRLVWKNGKALFIKSAKALQYEKDFLKQVVKGHTFTGPVKLEADIYYRTRRSDLDDTLLCDLIQKAGLVTNDRQIREKTLRAFIDPKNPRVEIILSESEIKI